MRRVLATFGSVVVITGFAACSTEDEANHTPASFDAGNVDLDAGSPSPADAARPEDASSDAPSPSDAPTPVDAAPPQLAFSADFETAIPAEVSPGTGVLTPSEGFSTLGPAGRTFGTSFLRSQTANVVKLSFTNLPPHKTLSIGFLFAAIDSLDGTGTFPAGDFFKVTVDGTAVLRESFANALDSQTQSYVAPPGGELARKMDLGFQGPGGYYRDSAYDMNVEPRLKGIAHTASSVTIELTIEGDGVQTLDDESWAIDNLSITTAN